MRITLEISDELLGRAKKRAADESTSLPQVVEAVLALYLARRSRQVNYKLHWRTESGRPVPGVRLHDRHTLFDLMDGRS